jgi:hypothetical protein
MRRHEQQVGLAMSQFHFSPKALGVSFLFLVTFALLIALERGSGGISRIWPSLMLCFLIGGSLAIYRRMWLVRGNPMEFRKAEAQSLYGVLPTQTEELAFPVTRTQ